jgi:hypothetical protein
MANGKWQIVMANSKWLIANSESQMVNGQTGSDSVVKAYHSRCRWLNISSKITGN